jgi:uncharacterized protein YjbI with pentapeptide repeats
MWGEHGGEVMPAASPPPCRRFAGSLWPAQTHRTVRSNCVARFQVDDAGQLHTLGGVRQRMCQTPRVDLAPGGGLPWAVLAVVGQSDAMTITLTAIGVLVALVLCVHVLPPRLIPSTAKLGDPDRVKAVGDARTALVQALGGAALVGTLYFTAVSLQDSRANTDRTLELTRRGQIADRFTRAVTQLGDAALDVRVGGIYALEQVARDATEDRKPIVEILTSYLQEHDRWQPSLPTPSPSPAPNTGDSGGSPEPMLRADFQAVVTVLGRRVRDPSEQDHLNLSGVDLKSGNFGGAHLEGANLVGAHLEGAYLVGAHLEGASLDGADLEGASLLSAHLEGASLDGADLEGASLLSAHLEGAYLVGAHLERANLDDAHLERAYLVGAHLERASLDGADLEGASLLSADLEGAYLVGAHLERANLNQANLTGVDLQGAYLEGAYLTGVVGLTPKQLGSTRGTPARSAPAPSPGSARPIPAR